jgi:hypothetical protein
MPLAIQPPIVVLATPSGSWRVDKQSLQAGSPSFPWGTVNGAANNRIDGLGYDNDTQHVEIPAERRVDDRDIQVLLNHLNATTETYAVKS